jgi:hypothetical protein
MSPSPILDHEVELAYVDSDQRWIATVSNGSVADLAAAACRPLFPYADVRSGSWLPNFRSD